MKFEWKKFKSLTGEETLCFEGDLWIDGKKAAHVRNSGGGGSCYVSWESKEQEKALTAYVKSLPPITSLEINLTYHQDVDSFLHSLACDHDQDKRLIKDCKKSICFRLPGDKKNNYRIFNNLPFTDHNVENVRAETPGIEILNYRFGEPKPHEGVWLTKLEKKCRTAVCVQAPEQKPWGYSFYQNTPFTAPNAEAIQVRHPDWEILNHRFGRPS